MVLPLLPSQPSPTEENQQLLGGIKENGKKAKGGRSLIFIFAFFLACLVVLVYFKTVVQDEKEEKTKATATGSLELLNTGLPMIPTTTTRQNNIWDQNCETTVLLVRHCDDHGIYARDDAESGDKHCSHMGYERTKFLPTLFGSRWPHPSFLYAQLPEQPRGTNYRQIETLLPLAQQEDLSIHVVREPHQVSAAIFDKIRTNPDEMCDKVTVVAWKHAYIPEVALNLGCGPDQGCRDNYPDDDFDQVWELKFVYRPEEPTEEVLDLFHSNSTLISDEYNLLSMAAAEAASTDEDSGADGIVDDEDAPVLGWTVYGSITSQRFDPLALDQIVEMKASEHNNN